MKKSNILATLLGLAALTHFGKSIEVTGSEPQIEDGVLVLTDANFDKVLNKN